ncbi:MAG: hypothetical protein ACRC2H_01140 [Silanimonas sp.]
MHKIFRKPKVRARHRSKDRRHLKTEGVVTIPYHSPSFGGDDRGFIPLAKLSLGMRASFDLDSMWNKPKSQRLAAIIAYVASCADGLVVNLKLCRSIEGKDWFSRGVKELLRTKKLQRVKETARSLNGHRGESSYGHGWTRLQVPGVHYALTGRKDGG